MSRPCCAPSVEPLRPVDAASPPPTSVIDAGRRDAALRARAPDRCLDQQSRGRLPPSSASNTRRVTGRAVSDDEANFPLLRDGV